MFTTLVISPSTILTDASKDNLRNNDLWTGSSFKPTSHQLNGMWWWKGRGLYYQVRLGVRFPKGANRATSSIRVWCVQHVSCQHTRCSADRPALIRWALRQNTPLSHSSASYEGCADTFHFYPSTGTEYSFFLVLDREREHWCWRHFGWLVVLLKQNQVYRVPPHLYSACLYARQSI